MRIGKVLLCGLIIGSLIGSQVAFALAPTVSNVVAGNLYVPATTAINCELVTPLDSGKNKEGDRVVFKTTENLVINNVVVIPKGSTGEGIVTKASGAGAFGKGGTIEMRTKSVKAINNVEVPVSFVKREGGGGKSGWVVPAFLFLSIFAGFINGSDMKLPPGTTFQATVVNDTDLGGTAEELQNWAKGNTMTVGNVIQGRDASDNKAEVAKSYPEIMTTDQVADYLQISFLAANQLISEGKIQSFKVGDAVRIKKSDVDSYINTPK